MRARLARQHSAGAGQKTARIWSNAVARAGKNPCLPAPAGERFFTALATKVPDTIAVTLPSGNMTTGWGFALQKGESVAIDLGFLADAPGPAWTISAREPGDNNGTGRLSFTLDKTSANVGDVTVQALENLDHLDRL